MSQASHTSSSMPERDTSSQQAFEDLCYMHICWLHARLVKHAHTCTLDRLCWTTKKRSCGLLLLLLLLLSVSTHAHAHDMHSSITQLDWEHAVQTVNHTCCAGAAVSVVVAAGFPNPHAHAHNCSVGFAMSSSPWAPPPGASNPIQLSAEEAYLVQNAMRAGTVDVHAAVGWCDAAML